MAQELHFVSRGARIAACAWGAEDAYPLLAVHGWLDNAASFARLAPLLHSCRVVAVDLPGHGRSDHRSLQGGYNIWDDLPDLLNVANTLGWKRFSLLGHSRGCAVASLFAAALPERVDTLLLLDGFLASTTPAKHVAHQLGAFLRQSSRTLAERTAYASLSEAALRRAAKSACSVAAAVLLAERGLCEGPDGKWRWQHDSRLLNPSAIRLSAAQNRALLEQLRLPIRVILAAQGLARYAMLRRQCERGHMVEWDIVPGGHHFHMQEQVGELAALIEKFLRTHGFLN